MCAASMLPTVAVRHLMPAEQIVRARRDTANADDRHHGDAGPIPKAQRSRHHFVSFDRAELAALAIYLGGEKLTFIDLPWKGMIVDCGRNVHHLGAPNG